MKNKMQEVLKSYLAAVLLFLTIATIKMPTQVYAADAGEPVVETQEAASYFDFGKGSEEPARPGMATAAIVGAVLLTVTAIVVVVYIYKKSQSI